MMAKTSKIKGKATPAPKVKMIDRIKNVYAKFKESKIYDTGSKMHTAYKGSKFYAVYSDKKTKANRKVRTLVYDTEKIGTNDYTMDGMLDANDKGRETFLEKGAYYRGFFNSVSAKIINADIDGARALCQGISVNPEVVDNDPAFITKAKSYDAYLGTLGPVSSAKKTKTKKIVTKKTKGGMSFIKQSS